MKNSDFQKKRYEDFSSYDYEKNHGDRIKKVLSLFEPCPNGRILDIGCGDGYITQMIGRKTGAEMHGCDISLSALKEAEKKGVIAAEADLDGGKLPYQDKYFDAVFAGEVIEHVFDTDSFIEEIRRVLKDDGYLVLTTPNLASWCSRISLMLGWQPFGYDVSTKEHVGNPFVDRSVKPAGHIRVFSPSALKIFLINHHYQICLIRGHADCGNNTLFNTFHKFFSLYWGTAQHFIIKAKKLNQ